ncbi:MAG: hypothetical protein AB1810_11360 [Pseudomonadota bacterium]
MASMILVSITFLRRARLVTTVKISAAMCGAMTAGQLYAAEVAIIVGYFGVVFFAIEILARVAKVK